MGRGNVRVDGAYEGLYYIDYEDIHSYYRVNGNGEKELRPLKDLDCNDLQSGIWNFDEWESRNRQKKLLDALASRFTEMFPSFTPATDSRFGNGAETLLESNLFLIAVEDNEWSLAVELLQKDDPDGGSIYGLQGRHYQRYLEGLKECLLELLPSIGIYAGAWTSGRITREECLAFKNKK